MIRLLDEEGKGYVSLSDFVSFYEQGYSGEKISELPHVFERKKLWKKTIDENW